MLTTCASDYVTWRNELPPGVEHDQRRAGAAVSASKHERDPLRVRPAVGARVRAAAFARRRARLARRRRADEPGADRSHRRSTPRDYDYCLFFSYRYYHAYHGARAAAARAILVPTAERDAAIGLSIFQPIFRGVRALMYNSPEERAMIQAVVRQSAGAGVVVGVGSDVPAEPAARTLPPEVQHPRAVRGLRRPHRREQGLQGAVRVLRGLSAAMPHGKLSLVLIGNSLLPIPKHPRIRHLGFLDDARQVRRDGRRRAADHAVVLREPVDGGARSVGARPAGARQRQVRRAEGPVHPQQRRPVLRELRASSSRRCARSSRTAG